MLSYFLLLFACQSQPQPDVGFMSAFNSNGQAVNTIHLDARVRLYWSSTTNSADGNETVTIGVVSSSIGWFGLGLSELGGMYGSDIALFYMNSNGQSVLESRFVPGYNVAPVLNDLQNLKLVYSSQSYAGTSFIFQRSSKAPCNGKRFDILLDGTGQNLIYAFGETNNFGQHR
jgi:hypothetical protein